MPVEWNKDVEAELVADINFALSQSRLLKKAKPTWRVQDEPSYHLALQIVAQIKLSNWRFERGPPLKGHSIGYSKPPE